MSITCDICAEWSPGTSVGHRDICLDCFERNFAGAQPSLDPTVYVPAGPEARAALDAFLGSQHRMPPRERAAIARLAEVWRRQEAEETP